MYLKYNKLISNDRAILRYIKRVTIIPQVEYSENLVSYPYNYNIIDIIHRNNQKLKLKMQCYICVCVVGNINIF